MALTIAAVSEIKGHAQLGLARLAVSHRETGAFVGLKQPDV
jgi:hypothetical protein